VAFNAKCDTGLILCPFQGQADQYHESWYTDNTSRGNRGKSSTRPCCSKYGLSEAVLAQPGELLDRFDAAVLLSNKGRMAHKGATQQLEALAAELAAVVRTMDTRNRQRFAGSTQLLASWVSASTARDSKRGRGADPSGNPGIG
jgi:hypothetical protein